MTAEQRARLNAARERKGRARERHNAARQALATAQQSGDADVIRTAEAAVDAAWSELEQAQTLESIVLGQVDGGGRDFGLALANNVDVLQRLGEIAATDAQVVHPVGLGPIMSMEQTVAMFGRSLRAAPVDLGTDVGRGEVFDGITAPAAPPTSILDLWPARPVEVRTIDYLQRSGVGVPSGGPVVEGAMKPEADLQYDPAEAKPETFPGWVKVPRQQVDDTAELLNDIRTALRDGVLRNVERALVNGAAAFAMEGIKTVSGTIRTDLTGVDNLADAAALVLRDLGTLGVGANFIAVNPVTYTAEVIRKAQGSGEYLNVIDAQGRLHRVPLVQSVALADGEIVAGNAPEAGYIAIRQPVTALITQSDQDDFVRNMLTVLVELRATPVLKAPDRLATATIGAA
jgi:hypothetical protein